MPPLPSPWSSSSSSLKSQTRRSTSFPARAEMAPKGTRKRRLKQADFQKKKLRVGKTNVADNHTDTSFKSAKIALRPQRISSNATLSAESIAAKIARFKELAVQARHYSPQSRKDAIAQIHQLLSPDGAGCAMTVLGTVSSDLAALILDDNHAVRSSLLAFLNVFFSWIEETSVPVSAGAVMVAYATSAMSHILEAIRLDGLKFLRLLVTKLPSAIARNPSKVLPHFLDLIAAHAKSRHGNTAHALTALSFKSELSDVKGRSQLLESFYDFLRVVFARQSGQTKSARWSRSAKTASAGAAADASAPVVDWDLAHGWIDGRIQSIDRAALLSQPAITFLGSETADQASARFSISTTTSTGAVMSGPATAGSTGTETSNSAASFSGKRSSSGVETQESLIDTLTPMLTNLWIECSEALSATRIIVSPALTVCAHVAQILCLIFEGEHGIPHAFATKFEQILIKHFLPMFPFGKDCTIDSEKVDTTLVQMNMCFSRIFLTIDLAVSPVATESAPKNKKNGLFSAVSTYISSLLRSGQFHRSDAFHLDFALMASIANDLYMRMGDKTVLQALSDFQVRTKSLSLARGALQCIAGLGIEPLLLQKVSKWTLSLPRQLKNAKAAYPPLSETILDFLCSIAKESRKVIRRPDLEMDDSSSVSGKQRGSIDKAAAMQKTALQLMDALQVALIPFLYEPPTESTATSSSSSSLSPSGKLGPLVDMDQSIQQKVVTLLYYLPRWQPDLIRAISECFTSSKMHADSVFSLVDAIEWRQRDPEVALTETLHGSLVATVCVGYTRNGLASVQDTGGTAPSKSGLSATKAHESIASQTHRKWQHRTDLVHVASSQFSWSRFLPSLFNMLDLHLPPDGIFAILMLIATAVETNHQSVSLDQSQLARVATRINELVAYTQSIDRDTRDVTITSPPLNTNVVTLQQRLVSAIPHLDVIMKQ